MNSTRSWPKFVLLMHSVIFTTGLSIAGTASAQDAVELVTLINAYRASVQICEGKRTAPVTPLAADPLLSRVQLKAGASLNDALKNAGYQAARAEAIMVSGASTPNEVMGFVKQTYCRTALGAQYAAIGVARDGNAWRVVLAEPLLAADLGDWEKAGREVLKLVNTARAKPRSCGKQPFEAAPPVTWNGQLAAAALAHSRDMADQNYFRHEGRDGSEVSDRATRAGYQWRRVGENIAAGQGSAKQAVSGWLSSPGHCANLMNRDFREMGTAYAVNPKSDSRIYWTQVFGTPR